MSDMNLVEAFRQTLPEAQTDADGKIRRPPEIDASTLKRLFFIRPLMDPCTEPYGDRPSLQSESGSVPLPNPLHSAHFMEMRPLESEVLQLPPFFNSRYHAPWQIRRFASAQTDSSIANVPSARAMRQGHGPPHSR